MVIPPSPGDSTSGTPSLQFDPAAYETVRAGVASSIAQISLAKAAVPSEFPPGAVFGDLSAGAFGDLAQVCRTYHQTWAAEISSAAQAQEEIQRLLPVIRAEYEAADHESAQRIRRVDSAIAIPKVDPPIVVPPKSPHKGNRS